MNIDELLNRFFEAEDVNDLPQWEIGGVKLWPIIRTKLLFCLLDSNVGALRQSAPFTISKSVYLLRTLLVDSPRQLFQVRRSPVVALSSALMRRLVVEGKYFDVIYDFYRMVIPNMPILEDPWNALHLLPRFTSNVVDLDWIKLFGVLFGQVNNKYKERIGDFVNYTYNFLLENRLTIDKMAENAIEKIIKKSLVEAFLLRRLLVWFRPKVFFLHCAAYGGRAAIICKICKELGIVTAEPQHGVVNRYHPAYNYASSYRNRFGEYLPDYFLTFGSYWNNELERFPVKKIVIGNPYLTEQKKSFQEKEAQEVYCEHREKKQKIVLIISQPTVTELTVSLAVRLRDLLPSNYSIVYKPHPNETLSPHHKELLNHRIGLQIEVGELYTLLNNSTCVIGVYSTVLFEAVAFGKPVFIVNTPMARAYIPSHIGRFFNSTEELAQIIMETDTMDSRPIPEDLWASDWKKRLGEFIDTILSSA